MTDLELGQVFTPRVVADYMVNLFSIKDGSTILEPCFGEGALISSLLNKKKYIIDGIEIDKKLFDEVNRNKKYNKCNLYNGNFFEVEIRKEYDGVIMNPPYIRHERIDDLCNHGITKSILYKKERFKKLSKTSNLYMYFIIEALERIRLGGELIVIFPSSWIKSRNAQSFINELNKRGSIVKKIFINGNVFGKETLVDVVILKMVKGIYEKECTDEYVEYNNEKITMMDYSHNILINKNHVNLSDYCKIRRGITTGNNKLFINSFSDYYSEEEFVKEIISSPKNVIGYSTENAIPDKLLVINKNFEDIKDKNLKKYLELSKESIIYNQKPKTMLNQINKNLEWYKLKTNESRGIIFSYIIRTNIKFIMNDIYENVRDNFYILNPKIDKFLIFGLLNNYYTFSRIESIGKHYGGGILKIQKYDLDNIKIINVNCISKSDIEQIRKLSMDLIKFNDEKIILKITNIVSKYENICMDEVVARYYKQQKNRLVKGEKNEL